MLKYFIFSIYLYCSITIANHLPNKVVDVLKKSDISLNNISISVIHIGERKEEILSFNENYGRNPASTMKILTSVAALDILKPDYRWITKFFFDGKIKNMLDGNIYIDFQGEPKFIPEIILPMLHQWKLAGINNLNAKFVLDNSILANVPDSSSDDENNEVYAVKPKADNFAFNSISVRFNGSEVSLSYPIYKLHIKNNLVINNDLCPINKSWSNNISYSISEFDNIYTLSLNGNYSKLCFDKTLNIPISNMISNKDFFVRSLLGLWINIGGIVTKYPDIIYGNVDKNSQLLSEVNGLPLSDLVYDMNKFSNNLMARLIFLRLGIKMQNKNLNANLSTKVMLNYFSDNKIDTNNIIFENGSGLSQLERISTKQMTDILYLASTKPFFKLFLDSLPKSGIDGTMKNRLQDISGKAFLKTGTLNNVRAIAGYIDDNRGGYFAVSAIVNEENASKASPALDELVRWVVEQSKK